MRISAKAEYACAAMLELAARSAGPQPVRVKAIADAQGIHQGFLVQILLQLKTAGLVVSVRGASGGYQLARPPENISLASVINAMDDRRVAPRSALSSAGERRGVSPPVQRRSIPSPVVEVLLDVWREVQEAEQRVLEALSLAEVLRRTQQTNESSYQI
jgi:Rrf2 family protein